MARNPIFLNNPEKFNTPYTISKTKLESAIGVVLDKLEKMAIDHPNEMPSGSAGFKYIFTNETGGWIVGMYAGCHWLAYELTGKKIFRETGERLMLAFKEKIDHKIDVDHHDLGFLYIPSCVAPYKATGNELGREIGLAAANYLYEKSFSKEGKFIIRSIKSWHGSGCRTMMDSMMNVPLLFWAGKETGNEELTEAAIAHCKTTDELLLRADSSTYHHYQFDPETCKPVGGLTLQGHSNESCWSRGHAWGIYGFPVAYSYVKEEFAKKAHRDLTYFMLNHLPEDNVPAWDYDFTSTKAVKDSSAGVISVCGLNEMAKHLPDADPDKALFNNAAAMILDSTIDTCTGDNGIDYDGFLFHVTGYASAKRPERRHIDQTAVYGDYFYFESLLRLYNPNFRMYW